MSSDVAERTVVDGVDVLGSLSPSRASDFMTCPLLYRFRTIDRLPEPSSPDAVRGTVVHKVLENLFDLPAAERTPAHAQGMLEPAERELYVEALLESRLLLRGFVDRIDVAPDGAIRVVDYKTGRSPGEMFEAKALFQMKFYALVLWRMRGVVPAMLQLIYLGNGELLRYVPDERDLIAT